MKNVSVLIPVKDDARAFKAIESLVGQDCEIIVVQNGTEEPWKELESFCEKKEIIFHHHKVGSQSIAYNIGAKIAKGDIIVLADSDTFFSKNFIEDVRKNAEEGWIKVGGWVDSDLKEDVVANGAAFLFKSDYEKIGGCDEVHARGYGVTDLDFYLRAKKVGIRSKSIPEAVWYHPLTAHKRGFKVGMAEARANRRYPGYQKTWRMIGADVLEMFRIIKHIIGLVIGRII